MALHLSFDLVCSLKTLPHHTTHWVQVLYIGTVRDMSKEIQLPGFRFHPTEEELLDFYLKNIVYGKRCKVEVIGFLNIYGHDPWDLPRLSTIGEREWYFFVPRERKHGDGGRPSRITEKGYWKATGSDRKIISSSEPKRMIGLKKTLVFYTGRAPGGTKTDWVMNEFRMPDNLTLPKSVVLCKIYRKATSLKVLEQRAEMETKMNQTRPSSPLSPSETNCLAGKEEDVMMTSFPFPQAEAMKQPNHILMFQEHNENAKNKEKQREAERKQPSSSLKLPSGVLPIPELQLPKQGFELGQDQFLSISPWLQNLTPIINLLYF
ncbi:hypothetical protein IGI04_025697 [Brassica rapa subsp. trilocularis]|uniref:NAC domain-containing protein n=1 Tax=Brassica rapa subsp. trilocularis TaxID=1813537 RepID=A0ABQ7KWK0_BRACM|nr:hypothetical protein IGI04_025697 [Brassica rapa subsp. trilocularis]